MSRNFELLTEIEREVSAREPLPPASGGYRPYLAEDSVRETLSRGDQQVRQLVQRVFLQMNGTAPRQVVFFGADRSSDSSSICIAAGRMLASAAAKRVCLVDANLSSSRLSSMLAMDGAGGSRTKSSGSGETYLGVGSNLWLRKLTDTTGSGGDLPPVEEMRRLFRAIAERFDYVLIDAPDASSTGDALMLSSIADGSILVVEAHQTRRSIARTAKEKCDAAGVTLLGAVLDKRTFPIPELLYRLF
jgi:Mrp family chromosome partitioning ATPase